MTVKEILFNLYILSIIALLAIMFVDVLFSRFNLKKIDNNFYLFLFTPIIIFIPIVNTVYILVYLAYLFYELVFSFIEFIKKISTIGNSYE